VLLMYALEGRGKIFALGFVAGCGLSSIYGFMADAGRAGSSNSGGPVRRSAAISAVPASNANWALKHAGMTVAETGRSGRS